MNQKSFNTYNTLNLNSRHSREREREREKFYQNIECNFSTKNTVGRCYIICSYQFWDTKARCLVVYVVLFILLSWGDASSLLIAGNMLQNFLGFLYHALKRTVCVYILYKIIYIFLQSYK